MIEKNSCGVLCDKCHEREATHLDGMLPMCDECAGNSPLKKTASAFTTETKTEE